MTQLYFLPENEVWFPNPEEASEDGLLAFGGDLRIERLLAAYTRGIFPCYGENSPILWWAPNPRSVLFLDRVHIPRSLQKKLNKNPFSYSINQCFSQVISLCASLREKEKAWLVDDMIDAYCALHSLGYAHSVEVWQNGYLVGGVYGIVLGKIFFGESMFHLVSDASKAAIVFLCKYLQEHNFVLLDCQQESAHMNSFGAELIPRSMFQSLLKEYSDESNITTWKKL